MGQASISDVEPNFIEPRPNVLQAVAGASQVFDFRPYLADLPDFGAWFFVHSLAEAVDIEMPSSVAHHQWPYHVSRQKTGPGQKFSANLRYLSREASKQADRVKKATCFLNVPRDIREIRVRVDAGFGFHPVLEILEARATHYAVVARLTQAFKRSLPGLRYEAANPQWEMAEFEYRPHGWPQARRFVVARRFVPDDEPQSTLFTLGRYVYRAWVTNMDLTASGVWHYYDGRAGMEPRICELREDYALRKIPTASFAANALYLEIVRLAYNLVTAFQRNCLEESWQSLTLQKLRYKLFLLPGELTRPQNRPVLRLRESPLLQDLANSILRKVHRLKPIQL